MEKQGGAHMEDTADKNREANRLYWHTENSVGEIADRLAVSRRALYEMVQPESSGATCGACGGDVVFTNRSARATGVGRCQQCGMQCEISQQNADTAVDAEDVAETLPPYAAGWPRVQPVQRASSGLAARVIGIGGAAVAGAALGVAATLLVVRRR